MAKRARPEPVLSPPRSPWLIAGLLLGLVLAWWGWWPAAGAPRPTSSEESAFSSRAAAALATPGQVRGLRGSVYQPLRDVLVPALPTGAARPWLDLCLLAGVAALLLRWASPTADETVPPVAWFLVGAAVLSHPAAAAALRSGQATGLLLGGLFTLAGLACLDAQGARRLAGVWLFLGLMAAPEAATLLPLFFLARADPAEAPRPAWEGLLLGALGYLGLRWAVADLAGASAAPGGLAELGTRLVLSGQGAWRALVPGLPPPATPLDPSLAGVGGVPAVAAAVALLGLVAWVTAEPNSRDELSAMRLRAVPATGLVAALVPSGHGLLAPERWLLASLVALVAGVTWLLSQGFEPRRGGVAVVTCLLFSFVWCSAEGAADTVRQPLLMDVTLSPVEPLDEVAGMLGDGEAMLSRYDFHSARATFLKVLSATPEKYRVTKGLVIANAAIGDVPKALRRTRELLELDAAQARLDVTQLLDPFYQNQALTDEGLEYLHGLEGLWSEEPWMQSNFALLYERRGDAEVAAEYRAREAALRAGAPGPSNQPGKARQ